MQTILGTDLSGSVLWLGLLSKKARKNSRSSMGDGFVKASAFQLGASVSPFTDSLREKAKVKISKFAFFLFSLSLGLLSLEVHEGPAKLKKKSAEWQMVNKWGKVSWDPAWPLVFIQDE